jgi:hypothetical protein
MDCPRSARVVTNRAQPARLRLAPKGLALWTPSLDRQQVCRGKSDPLQTLAEGKWPTPASSVRCAAILPRSHSLRSLALRPRMAHLTRLPTDW